MHHDNYKKEDYFNNICKQLSLIRLIEIRYSDHLIKKMKIQHKKIRIFMHASL